MSDAQSGVQLCLGVWHAAMRHARQQEQIVEARERMQRMKNVQCELVLKLLVNPDAQSMDYYCFASLATMSKDARHQRAMRKLTGVYMRAFDSRLEGLDITEGQECPKSGKGRQVPIRELL